MSSVQIRNYSLLNAGENIPMASPALGSTKPTTEIHTNLCDLLPLYVSHYLTRGEMKITSFTVIRNSSEGALSGDAVGE